MKFVTPEKISIKTEFIRLDQFLKLANVVQGGGEAKMFIQSGDVTVNGETETRRGKKLRPGDMVEIGGNVFLVAEEP